MQLAQRQSIASPETQASTSNPQWAISDRDELATTSGIDRFNVRPMDAPNDAGRASSIETSMAGLPDDSNRSSSSEIAIPFSNTLIPQIIDLLSLVGRQRDVVDAEAQETRFRASLFDYQTCRTLGLAEPRIESLLSIKRPSAIRQIRINIASSKGQLQTQMRNLHLNQATLDLLKEELPWEGAVILDSLKLPEPNAYPLLRQNVDISSIFEQIKDSIFKILVLQNSLQLESNKLEFYPVSEVSEMLPGDQVPDAALLKAIQTLSIEDAKKIPVRLHAALNEKTTPILQSVIDLSDALVTEQRAKEAHGFVNQADIRARKEMKIKRLERIVEQSEKRLTRKEQILDTSLGNLWKDAAVKASIRVILGLIALRAPLDSKWGEFERWSPVAMTWISEIAAFLTVRFKTDPSIENERQAVSDERHFLAKATLELRQALEEENRYIFTNVGTACQTIITTYPIWFAQCMVTNGNFKKDENGNFQDQAINARKLPPFTRYSQYALPIMISALSTLVAVGRQLQANQGGGSTLSSIVEDFGNHGGNVTFSGSVPGPFNISGHFAP